MTPYEEYLAVAEELAKARVRFAEEFLLRRSKLGRDGTDKQAEMSAIITTHDDITYLTAKLKALEGYLP